MADIPAIKVGVPTGPGGFDISLVGDKQLQNALNSLERKVGRKIVQAANRNSAKRLRSDIITKVGGGFFKHPTGNLLNAMKATKVKAGKRSRTEVSMIWPAPTRAALNIPRPGKHVASEVKFYYPWALEYGAQYKDGRRLPAQSYIRTTVHQKRRRELRLIGRDIGRGVEAEFKRRAAKVG